MTREEILTIGKHCSLGTCRKTDFLPAKCVYCKIDYCAEHATPSLEYSDEHHYCESYKEAEIARNSKSKNSYNELDMCSQESCNTKLISPISCIECSRRFCTYHYHPNTHSCQTSTRLANSGRSAASNNAGLAALKRLGQSNSNTTPKQPPKQAPKRDAEERKTNKESTSILAKVIPNMERMQAGGSIKTPLASLKHDKRSKSERDSQMRALLDREKKGILSSNDKLRLAEMRALESQSPKARDCKVQ